MSEREGKGPRMLWPPDELIEEIEKDASTAPVVTPQSLALKYGIRVSVARRLLRDMERRGLVIYVDGNSRLRIYRGAKAKRKAPSS